MNISRQASLSTAYVDIQTNSVTATRKKKCHGNRKLQHFKRKCRAHGITEDEITKLIESRNNQPRTTNSIHNHDSSTNSGTKKSKNKKKTSRR